MDNIRELRKTMNNIRKERNTINNIRKAEISTPWVWKEIQRITSGNRETINNIKKVRKTMNEIRKGIKSNALQYMYKTCIRSAAFKLCNFPSHL